CSFVPLSYIPSPPLRAFRHQAPNFETDQKVGGLNPSEPTQESSYLTWWLLFYFGDGRIDKMANESVKISAPPATRSPPPVPPCPPAQSTAPENGPLCKE